MARITFVEADGREVEVEIRSGWTLMEGARAAGITGILAECGGACLCATCHCYVDEAWRARLPAPRGDEQQMLFNVAAERRVGSRLACQLCIRPELDGLRVSLPGRQA